ncbi:MAG: C4-dicarboxylic acid transporter DauA [Nitrospirota bacterium]
MFSAIKETAKSSYSFEGLRSDLFAGLTIGVIALPLSMALAIATGAAPQHGLYTAIVAGIVIALSGGSRVNISGPTAAFVVILVPITQKYGLGGLLISGLMAGLILVGMGMARLGTLIQVVPYPVTIGFTAGIGVVIATLQIKDFLGLNIGLIGGHYIENIETLVNALPTLRLEEMLIGALTFMTLLLWTRLKTRIPAHLVALFAGSIAAMLASLIIRDFNVATIGSRFHYNIGSITGSGIPPFLPQFVWPWELPDSSGSPVGISFHLVKKLLPSSFAIAILGALESLLCATVADGMAGTKHDPNDELIGQGIGNIVTPFFGGIPATAAIARTAANIRAGASSPIASVVHAIFILFGILILAPMLAYIPMASMAALLIMVAWNMSEAKHFVRIVKIAPRSDVATLLTCFGLTVLFDMEIAVAVGMGLAGALFIVRTIELTDAKLIEQHEHPHTQSLPKSVVLYDINGPLFFGAAQKALSGLTTLRPEIKVVILDMSDVTMIDMTAMAAMETIIENLRKKGILLIICSLAPRMILKLRRAGVRKKAGEVEFARTLESGIKLATAQRQ